MKFCFISIFVLIFSGTVSAQTTLYVSPTGDDANPGTENAPLASLQGARDRIRRLDRGKSITVIFSQGTYRFNNAVVFTKNDSGTAKSPVVYKAARGAKVRFTGGVTVEDWKKVTDRNVLNQFLSKARPHVRVANLNGLGLKDFGRYEPYGFSKSTPPSPPELVSSTTPLTLARWPNQGFEKAVSKLDAQRIVVDTSRMARWMNEVDPWIFAYWHHSWAELYEPLAGVDPRNRVIERRKDIKPLKYGITPEKSRWYALNLLSEIDSPGEFYIDRKNGLAYIWPPEDDKGIELTKAMGLIYVNGTSNIIFEKLVIEASRGTAVTVRNGTNVKIIGCTIRNAGIHAVSISGGTEHEIYGCDISYSGSDAITIRGGNIPTLTSARHKVENNHIHHFARRSRSYKGAIRMKGVGIYVAHNLIHHSPHGAIFAGGNNHIIEFNEVHNVIQECGDAGALYQGRTWHKRGTQIRYNYWHDIVAGVGHGMVIYQDDQNCGQTIHGNIFERVARAVYLGGGRDHNVTNNVFHNCWRSVHLDDRGLRWPEHKRWVRGPDGPFHEGLQSVPYKNELWRNQYPTLANILKDEPGTPKGNVFRSNISSGGTWDDITPSTKKDQTIKDNLAFDDDSRWITLVKDRAGRLTDIRFKNPIAVRNAGFKPISVQKIGLYKDPRRASWPVERQVDRLTLSRLQIDNRK